jgi:hypothetical protein
VRRDAAEYEEGEMQNARPVSSGRQIESVAYPMTTTMAPPAVVVVNCAYVTYPDEALMSSTAPTKGSTALMVRSAATDTAGWKPFLFTRAVMRSDEL